MAKYRLDGWPEEASGETLEVFRANGGYAEEGTARCLFCRPTDGQLASLRAGNPPNADEDYFQGRNIFSLLWAGDGLRDQIRLARKMLTLVGEGGVFATHSLADYKEWHPDRHRSRPCR